MADHPTKKRRTEKSALPSTQTKSAFKQPQQADPPSSSASENENDSLHESGDGSEVDNGAVASKPQNKEKKEKNPKSSKTTADDEFDVSATSDNDNDNDDDNDEYEDPISDSDLDNDVDDSDDNDSDSSLDSILAAQSNLNPSKKRKRNNPTVFATSLSKILNSNLSTKARADPVLVRARKGTTQVVDENKLELKAKRVLKEERRKELEKGRVKDILPTNVKNGVDLARVLERERALRKIAQRGVVRLFNAVRAAQVKSEEAREEVRRKGIVGLGKKEEKVTEMSKQGFLDLIQATPAK